MLRTFVNVTHKTKKQWSRQHQQQKEVNKNIIAVTQM